MNICQNLIETVDILGCGNLPPPLTARKRTAEGSSPTAKNSRTVSFIPSYSAV